MARNKGQFKFAANFEVQAQEALDPRVVVVVFPEPSCTLGSLNHVFPHQVGGQCHRHVSETLVSVGGDEVYPVVHCGIDPVHCHLHGVDVFKNQPFVHFVGRACLHEFRTSCRHGYGGYANYYP